MAWSFYSPELQITAQVAQMGAGWGRREQGQHDHSRNYNPVQSNSELVVPLCGNSICGKFTLSAIQVENGEKQD